MARFFFRFMLEVNKAKFKRCSKKSKLRSVHYDHYRIAEGSNNKSSETLVKFIPEDLILAHILPKLPVKSLLRFKSVSKLWLSTISTPEFAQSHLNCYPSPPQLIYLRETERDEYDEDKEEEDEEEKEQIFYLLPYDEATNRVGASIPLTLCIDDSFDWMVLVGSCNGLVCIIELATIHDMNAFVVWNPATHQRLMISQPDDVDFFDAYGFGYSSKLDDYKIVGFQQQYDLLSEDELWVYSLRSDEWKRINSSTVSDATFEGPAVVINDDVCWKGIDDNEIFVFNLFTEELENIPFECLSKYVNKSVPDFWMLKELGDWNSWQKVFFMNTRRRVKCFSSNGKCLVQPSMDKFELIEPTREALDRAVGIVSDSFGRIEQVREYEESLISPFGWSS